MAFDYKFWILAIISVWGLYYSRKQVKLMSPQTTATTAGKRFWRAASVQKYWPTLVTIVLILSVWVSYFFPLHRPTWEWQSKLTPVHDHYYANERVIVDGKDFYNCSFKDVTYVYNGTGPVRFHFSHFAGSQFFASENEGVDTAMALLIAFGASDMPAVSPDGRSALRDGTQTGHLALVVSGEHNDSAVSEWKCTLSVES